MLVKSLDFYQKRSQKSKFMLHEILSKNDEIAAPALQHIHQSLRHYTAIFQSNIAKHFTPIWWKISCLQMKYILLQFSQDIKAMDNRIQALECQLCQELGNCINIVRLSTMQKELLRNYTTYLIAGMHFCSGCYGIASFRIFIMINWVASCLRFIAHPYFRRLRVTFFSEVRK